jgi:hypothetical protein
MSRDLPVEFISELTKEAVYPFFAIEIEFVSGPLYFWTGYGELEANGNTYLGAGQLVNISSVEETTEIEAKGATITMSGIPSSFLTLALTEPYQGRSCRIYFGLWLSNSQLSTESDQVITTENLFNFQLEGNNKYFAEIFSGELDQMSIFEQGSTATVSVTAENVLIKLERPVVRRFTNEDQKSRFAADKGLEFVAGLQDKEVFWGKASPQTNALTVVKQAVSTFRDR